MFFDMCSGVLDEVPETYVLEPHKTAEQFIEFDRSFSKLFSSE